MHTTKKYSRFIFCISILVFIISCQSSSFIEHRRSIIPEEINWNPICQGITSYSYRDNNNHYTIVKIDLNDSFDFITYETTEKGYHKSKSVKSFSKENNCVVSINTTPFRIKNKMNLHSKVRTGGMVIKNKEVLMNYDYYSCLCLYKDKDNYKAKIYEYSSEVLNQDLPEYAMGGFYSVLKDGKILQGTSDGRVTYASIKNFRSCCATKDNGKTLLLFAGNNLTFQECGQIFLSLGCDDAMALDGGTSSSLIINQKETLPMLFRRNVGSILGICRTKN